MEQTAPEEEAKKEAPMEPAADAGDGWEESEGSEEKADEASADSKPQEQWAKRTTAKGRRPKLQDRKLADRSNRMSSSADRNPLADGGGEKR